MARGRVLWRRTGSPDSINWGSEVGDPKVLPLLSAGYGEQEMLLSEPVKEQTPNKITYKFLKWMINLSAIKESISTNKESNANLYM